MKAFHLFVLTVLLLAFSAAVKAADLQVSVFEAIGSGNLQPVVGARICVGTPSDPAQVGSLVMNNTDGYVSFNNVSPGQYLVTVSADGYFGQQRTVNITGSAASAAFSMERCASGDCGRTCNGISTRPNPRQPPNGDLTTLITHISDFYINHKEFEQNDPTRRKPSLSISRDVRLYFNYTGVPPTQYRASESSDFADTAWRDLPSQSSGGDPFVNYTLIADGPARRTVYFQVRASSGLGGLLSLNSNVADDRVDLQLSRLKQYAVAGAELIELLNYAQSQGYTFNTNPAYTNMGAEPGYSPCKILDPPTHQRNWVLPAFNDSIDFRIPGMKMSVWQANPTGGFGISETRVLTGNFFGGRVLNSSWRMRDPVFAPGAGWDGAGPSTAITIIKHSTEDDPKFIVSFRFAETAPVIWKETVSGQCKGVSIQLIDIFLEGPEEADWVDVNRKWKNAFVHRSGR